MREGWADMGDGGTQVMHPTKDDIGDGGSGCIEGWGGLK